MCLPSPMPELLLTRSCDYGCGCCCQARSLDPSGVPRDLISWEDLVYVADFLLASGEPRITLSGGEPSLHPEFVAMTAYLVERGFEVAVSTAGIRKGKALGEASAVFEAYPPQRFSIILNLDPLIQGDPATAEADGIQEFLENFGNRCFPTIRLGDADFDLTDPLQLIFQFGMSRNLSVGLCHPILGHGSPAPEPSQIRAIVNRFFSFADLMERFRIQPIFACGWPQCCFDDGQMSWLARNAGRCDFTCGPTIGIGPDLTVWPCFPLNRFRNRSLFEFNSLQEIIYLYFDAFNKVKVEAGGIFPDCDTCRFRDLQRCGGGCLVHNVLSFLDEEPLRLPEVYP